MPYPLAKSSIIYRSIPKPALPVAALVCGYPGDRRRLRRLLMIQAYVDDSMTDGEVLVLAGLLASVERWEAFSVAWQERLDHARWPFFHMADVWFRGSDEALEHAKWHYYTIRDHAQGAICMTVPLFPLRLAAIKFGLAGTAAANPYTWAIKGLVNNLAAHGHTWGLQEPVDFIFDERPKEENDVREVWDHYISTLSEEVRNMTGRKPIFENDKKVLPLQAADMWAWWCRKTWRDNGGIIPADAFPIPWGSVGEIPQFTLQWAADEIHDELARVAAGVEALRKGPPP